MFNYTGVNLSQASIRLLVFFIQRNHIEVLISVSTLSLSSIIHATKLFKALRIRYCMEVPVLDSYRYLHNRSQDHVHSLFYALLIETTMTTPFYASCVYIILM